MAARGHFWSRVRKRLEEIIKLPAVETNSESKLSIQCRKGKQRKEEAGIVSTIPKKVEEDETDGNKYL